MEQKTKELEELNSATKKLIQNKENIILKYESELEMKNKEKILLISQNKELLNKLNDGNTDKEEKNNNENYLLNEEIKSQNKELLNKLNDGNTDKEEKNNNENYLLNEEIKTLKEQLENQAHNLLKLTAMENQINILQLENENLKQKKTNEKNEELSLDDRYANSENLKHSVTTNINKSTGKKIKKRLSITIVKDKQNNNEIKNVTKTLDKKEEIIKPKEVEKRNEKEKNLEDENEKLKDEITKLKLKHLHMEFENESKLVKLKNVIKNIEKQCNKVGVKIDFNFNNLI